MRVLARLVRFLLDRGADPAVMIDSPEVEMSIVDFANSDYCTDSEIRKVINDHVGRRA